MGEKRDENNILKISFDGKVVLNLMIHMLFGFFYLCVCKWVSEYCKTTTDVIYFQHKKKYYLHSPSYISMTSQCSSHYLRAERKRFCSIIKQLRVNILCVDQFLPVYQTQNSFLKSIFLIFSNCCPVTYTTWGHSDILLSNISLNIIMYVQKIIC